MAPLRARTLRRLRARPLDENHEKQTLAFVLAKKKEYLGLNRRRMGIWETMEYLNTLVDDSDPDTSLTQIEVRVLRGHSKKGKADARAARRSPLSWARSALDAKHVAPPEKQHLLQTAEAIRRDGHPRWFILTGLIHDLGKILCLWGEPQWAVVGDTNPGTLCGRAARRDGLPGPPRAR